MTRDYIREAWDALRARKTRSTIASLGVCIATATVVMSGTAITSGVAAAVDRLRRLGDHTLFVVSGGADAASATEPAHPLSLSDVKALRDELPSVSRVVPQLAFGATVSACGGSRLATVVATTAAGLVDGDFKIARVQPWTSAASYDNDEPIAVIGASLAKGLPCLRTVPSDIRIDRALAVSRGVLEPRGGNNGQDLDSVVIVPLEFAEQKLAAPTLRPLAVRVDVAADAGMDAAEADVQRVLRRAHSLANGAPDDFRIVRQTYLVNQLESATGSARSSVIALFCWAFLLGAVCIANAVSASVAERTSEIGLRRAVGATKWAISAHFITEGLILGAAGCALGVIVGFWCGGLIATEFLSVAPVHDWSIAWTTAGINVLLSFFGTLIPATMAAERPVIKALEHG